MGGAAIRHPLGLEGTPVAEMPVPGTLHSRPGVGGEGWGLDRSAGGPRRHLLMAPCKVWTRLEGVLRAQGDLRG